MSDSIKMCSSFAFLICKQGEINPQMLCFPKLINWEPHFPFDCHWNMHSRTWDDTEKIFSKWSGRPILALTLINFGSESVNLQLVWSDKVLILIYDNKKFTSFSVKVPSKHSRFYFHCLFGTLPQVKGFFKEIEIKQWKDRIGSRLVVKGPSDSRQHISRQIKLSGNYLPSILIYCCPWPPN